MQRVRIDVDETLRSAPAEYRRELDEILAVLRLDVPKGPEPCVLPSREPSVRLLGRPTSSSAQQSPRADECRDLGSRFARMRIHASRAHQRYQFVCTHAGSPKALRKPLSPSSGSRYPLLSAKRSIASITSSAASRSEKVSGISAA